MVHYEPSAQVPARRGGRAAGPTPAAGAASSAGWARARGRPAAFVGPPSRRAALAPVALPRGESFPHTVFMSLAWWRGKGWARRDPLCSLRTPRVSPCSGKAARVPGTCLQGCLGYNARGFCGLVRFCWPAGSKRAPADVSAKWVWVSSTWQLRPAWCQACGAPWLVFKPGKLCKSLLP